MTFILNSVNRNHQYDGPWWEMGFQSIWVDPVKREPVYMRQCPSCSFYHYNHAETPAECPHCGLRPSAHIL